MASLTRKCQTSNNLFNPQTETKDQKSLVHVETGRKWPEASLGSDTALSDPLFHDEMMVPTACRELENCSSLVSLHHIGL